ncbi:hypothetical protein FCULG_00007098 [Fusarium culmorum]|uniref:Prion-inhibition and propagation HeLo domain-containing protein n=1 Tax=Fusarium culmorum TaxID=5516 RepID=A0A2T4GWU3_FUSCU|nr:hypothetical protein FCULG_00007098 [Fusarium culmorum]
MAEIGPAFELFRFILSTLGQIQLARNFEDDFEAGIKEVLNEIEHCLDRYKRNSRRDKDGLTKENQEAPEPESNLPSDIKSIRRRLMQCIRKRQSQASTAIQGLKWVFYKKEVFDQFIGSMTELLDELEKIAPGDDHEQLYKLSEEECGDITKMNLLTLKERGQAGTQNIYQSNNRGFTVGNHNGDNKGFTVGEGNTLTNHF